MKVSTRIILSFVMLGVFIIIASYMGIRPIENQLKEIGTFHSTTLYSIQSINSKLTGAVEESFAYVVSGDAQEKEEFLQWADVYHRVHSFHGCRWQSLDIGNGPGHHRTGKRQEASHPG